MWMVAVSVWQETRPYIGGASETSSTPLLTTHLRAHGLVWGIWVSPPESTPDGTTGPWGIDCFNGASWNLGETRKMPNAEYIHHGYMQSRVTHVLQEAMSKASKSRAVGVREYTDRGTMMIYYL